MYRLTFEWCWPVDEDDVCEDCYLVTVRYHPARAAVTDGPPERWSPPEPAEVELVSIKPDADPETIGLTREALMECAERELAERS